MSNSNWLAAFALVTLASCGGSVDNVIVKTPKPYVCNKPQKITAIYPEYVYDLSGYADVTGPAAYALFDENSISDPKSPGDFKPITNPHPQYGSPTYFRDYGSRIVVDLRVPYKLSEIYFYDRARHSDSVWIYTGTMQNWKLKAAYLTSGNPTAWGWRKFTVSDSTRFV